MHCVCFRWTDNPCTPARSNDTTKQSSLSSASNAVNRPASSYLLSSGVSGGSLGDITASLLSGSRGSLASLSGLSGAGNRGSLLKLSASESSALELNTETLKDLFWTLYSKLDAVLQGFRVSYEVAGRIAEVSRPGQREVGYPRITHDTWFAEARL